jgi:hypothetical protein
MASWIQPRPHGAILKHFLNPVNLLFCSFTNYFENQLLSNDLIIVKNHGNDGLDKRDIKRSLERQGDADIKVEIQSNLEFQSLTLSPTQSIGPPQHQIDVQEEYQIGFERSAYPKKDDETIFPMVPVPSPNKVGLDQNFRSNVNIQSPIHAEAIHIKTDAQVTYDIQLGRSWTPLKVKEGSFSMEQVPCPNSSESNGNY